MFSSLTQKLKSSLENLPKISNRTNNVTNNAQSDPSQAIKPESGDIKTSEEEKSAPQTKNTAQQLSATLGNVTKKISKFDLSKPTNKILETLKQVSVPFPIGTKGFTGVDSGLDVNPGAGLELMNRIESQLVNIHNRSILIHQKSLYISEKIQQTEKTFKQKTDHITLLELEAKVLPLMEKTIDQMFVDIVHLCAKMSELEDIYSKECDEVEDLKIKKVEEAELSKTKQTEALIQSKLEQLKIQARAKEIRETERKLQLEAMRVQKELEEAKSKAKEKEREDQLKAHQLELEKMREKTKQLEIEQERIVKQRQDFEAAFQKEMNDYKTLGKLPKKSKNKPSRQLEQVQLFQDSTESNSLEDFLGSAPDWSQLASQDTQTETGDKSHDVSDAKSETKTEEKITSNVEAVEDVDEEWFSSN